jgi:hypothetical protein
MNLAELLRPVSVAEFYDRWFGQRFLPLLRNDNRFHSLFGWRSLNGELSRLRIRSNRVRLARGGAIIEPRQYIVGAESPHGGRLNPPAISRLLDEGATLIVDAVDELAPEVQELVENLEEELELAIGANAYAGWRAHQGFDTHWDDHDAFIVQVAGRKMWRVWEPTGPLPLRGESSKSLRPPGTTPYWEGVLRAGDALYLPRGWWHQVICLDQPTIHLTLGFSPTTGVEFLRWLVDSIRDESSLRLAAPLRAGMDEKIRWLDSSLTFLRMKANVESVDRFRASSLASRRPRGRFVLPAGSNGSEIADTMLISLSDSQRIVGIDSGSAYEFVVSGRRYSCPIAFRAALDTLRGHRATAVSHLRSLVPNDQQPDFLRFLNTLIGNGSMQAEHTERVLPVDAG